MGAETGCSASSSSSSASSSTTSSPSAKRSRDPEDDLYIDNLHSHKRYLTEIMASSLNGLTVGDPIPESLLESPARSEAMVSYPRDDLSWQQYSPMSEDSDDSRFCDASTATTTTVVAMSGGESGPSSPVSPYRNNHSHYYHHQRSRSCDTSSEGRFPSSPSDICHSADLRRAALLRSVQMRSHHHHHSSSMEAEEDRPCQYAIKSMAVDEEDEDDEYRIIDCSPIVANKSSRVLSMDVKENDHTSSSAD